MKTVYRIERHDGTGMYRCANNSTVSALDIMGYDDMQHPMPDDDSLLAKRRVIEGVSDIQLRLYRFGFDSVRQVRNWVYKDAWLIALHDSGFVISEYLCNDYDVIVGHTQAIFKNEIEKESFSILEYFKV